MSQQEELMKLAQEIEYEASDGASPRRMTELADKIRSIAKAAQGEEPVAWRGLSDSQWMNIVNHQDVVRWDANKDDAVHLAVKLTEQRLKENNAPPSPSAQVLVEALPEELFDGHAVYRELGAATPIAPSCVSDVLDAVVRLIRRRQHGQE